MLAYDIGPNTTTLALWTHAYGDAGHAADFTVVMNGNQLGFGHFVL